MEPLPWLKALLAPALGLVLFAAIAGLSFWLYPGAPPPARLALAPREFADLPGWADDDHSEALRVFLRSCDRHEGKDEDAAWGTGPYKGTRADILEACAGAKTAPTDAARQFFETFFRPFAVLNNDEDVGLFTGYYEPELTGSKERRDQRQTPLYGRPQNLVMVDLGLFRDEWQGERIAGRVTKGSLLPMEARSDIVKGALGGDAPVIAYADSAIDAFFLEIQGSGRLVLPDGATMHLGYDGQNGHPYVAIGKTLIARGELTRETVSMQSIRAWLEAHPDAAQGVMDTNPSFVFFKEIETPDPSLGAFGAAGVQLTPRRSLAVDRRFHALDVPLWLETTVPDQQGARAAPFRHLMIAQDTGGAIKGPVRGDIYWGHGAAAAAIAGPMKQEGRLWVLLPRAAAARVGS